ncbi:MAG: glutaredoxin domain-containing protein [Anaerolineales bacterium]|jgi:mycoredoxin
MSDQQPERPLIIYGHNYCGQSRLLVTELDEKQIPYEWRDVRNGDPIFQEELKKLARGNLSVPTVVFPDGSVLIEPWPKEVVDRLKRHEPNVIQRLFKKS